MKTIKVQDATYEILVRLSRKLKVTPEALADRVITEIQKGYLLKQIINQ